MSRPHLSCMCWSHLSTVSVVYVRPQACMRRSHLPCMCWSHLSCMCRPHVLCMCARTAGVIKVMAQLSEIEELDVFEELDLLESTDLSNVEYMPAYLNKRLNNRSACGSTIWHPCTPPPSRMAPARPPRPVPSRARTCIAPASPPALHVTHS